MFYLSHIPLRNGLEVINFQYYIKWLHAFFIFRLMVRVLRRTITYLTSGCWVQGKFKPRFTHIRMAGIKQTSVAEDAEKPDCSHIVGGRLWNCAAAALESHVASKSWTRGSYDASPDARVHTGHLCSSAGSGGLSPASGRQWMTAQGTGTCHPQEAPRWRSGLWVCPWTIISKSELSDGSVLSLWVI